MPVNSSNEALNDALALRLKDDGRLPAAKLRKARDHATASGMTLDRAILDLRLLPEEELLPVLCEVIDCPYCETAWSAGTTVDAPAIAALSLDYLSRQRAVPLSCPEDAPAQPVLLAAPADRDLLAELSFHLGRALTPVGATSRTVRQVLSRAGTAPQTEDRADAAAPPPAKDAEEAGPVIRYVDEKLADAVALGASDLHFEPTPQGLTLRYRVNGLLTPPQPVTEHDPAAITARLKVMAAANVAERRLPQDGHLSAQIAGRAVDFRFSSLPTQAGESIVLRVLDPQALRLDWSALGFTPELSDKVVATIERPSGLFLVTGPTGSGKTTTLYAAVAHLNAPHRKIITVEDPVEYRLPGIQQVQVHEEIGLSFAQVLRAILRHDPNVILIGEIRDRETAEIACRAALVGRMVLSTLHTSSAEGAAIRLQDLGVPPYMVREVLKGVLAQELLITRCEICAGDGCPDCGYTGTGKRRFAARFLDTANRS
jgi:general secretion pathway protein E